MVRPVANNRTNTINHPNHSTPPRTTPSVFSAPVSQPASMPPQSPYPQSNNPGSGFPHRDPTGGNGGNGGDGGGDNNGPPPNGPPNPPRPPQRQRRKPRVGDILDGIPWTGGSNLQEYQYADPMSINQYRPMDYKSAKAAITGANEGLDEDDRLSLPNEKQVVKLTKWINEVKIHIEDYGMDTVFRVASLPSNAERYIIDEWGLCKYRPWIDEWVNQLQTGVVQANGTRAPVCPFDQQNLQWSGKFLLNSISKNFRNLITPDLGSQPPGPIVFYKIINKVQMMSAEAMRRLEGDLKQLQLKA